MKTIYKVLYPVGYEPQEVSDTYNVALPYVEEKPLEGLANEQSQFFNFSERKWEEAVTQDYSKKLNLLENLSAVLEADNATLKQANEKLTAKFKVRVEIGGISLSKLKELILDCRSHNDDSLLNCMKRFHNYRQRAKSHKVSIWYNERYNEFSFAEMVNGECRLNGGIIFHGWPGDDYQTNGSIQLEPR